VRNLILRPALAGLARRLTGLRDGGRGAIGVLVAVLIGAGVLLGMAALVIDVGQLYENRAELQNGADAAALAVAKSCATGTCDPSTAAKYANDNASSLTGGKALVNFVCGATGTNGTVPVGSGLCPVAKNVCPPNPPAGANFVDVETSTLLPNGSTLLPPVFAGTLAGSHSGGTVFACAQVEWGGPATSATVGFTISACTWDAAVGWNPATGQATFAPPPPYPPNPAVSFDQTVYLKGGPNLPGCTTEPNGAAGPGNFGWTDDPNGNCTTFVNAGIYGGNTGNSVSQACKLKLQSWQANRTVLDVPAYVMITNPGANATYTLAGFAEFVITGYSLPGMTATDWVTSKVPCSNGASCISGFFTHELVPTSGSAGGRDMGATVIKLTG
jgi:Flp pilus assembly protein TadG